MSNHHIVHFEIASTDQEKADKFYSDLFEWNVETMQPPMEYKYIQTGEGHPTGGIVPADGEMGKEGDVMLYVSTDDVDASLAKAESLGGAILTPKFEIPTVGWMGVIGDPTGNKVAVIKFVEQSE